MPLSIQTCTPLLIVTDSAPISTNPFPLVDLQSQQFNGLQPQFTSVTPQFTSFNPYQQQLEQQALQVSRVDLSLMISVYVQHSI